VLEEEGAVKVLTVPGKDRILGVTIVGEHAGEVIAEYAAGRWKQAHTSARALTWLARFHAWRRGGGSRPSPGRAHAGPEAR